MISGQIGRSFQRKPLERHLNACLHETLGDLDQAGVFSQTGAATNKGIAGDVVEQSILFLKRDSKQEPDIVVDGVRYEVKSTGIRRSKRDKRELEAKEPVSITAVSPDRIVAEDFDDSAFLHKIAHIVFFYYLYNSDQVGSMLKYADFPFVSYQFHEFTDFTEEEQRTLEADWACVRDFIATLQRTFVDFRSQYPRLSSELRDSLLLLDTAPKWPHPPRFRFKRSFVTNIFRRHLEGRHALEQLPERITSKEELVRKCRAIAAKYAGKKIQSLLQLFGITPSSSLKSIAEPLIVKMFGGQGKRMEGVEFFSKVGIIGKSVVLTASGGRTEDAKFFTIDFEEFARDGLRFEDSQFYEYFSSHRLLAIVFEEPSHDASLLHNKFLGFSLVSFPESFIQHDVRTVWERTRSLILQRTLKDVPIIDHDTGLPVLNKNGVVRSAPNFPKSSEGNVFIRGTSTDSSNKPELVNGIRMYHQQVWMKGSLLADWIANAGILPGTSFVDNDSPEESDFDREAADENDSAP